MNHGYQGAKAALRKSDVHKAAYDWLMDYEGMRNNPEQWYLEKGPSGQPGRYPDGDHWYAKFGANDTGADNSGDVSDPDDSGGTGNTVVVVVVMPQQLVVTGVGLIRAVSMSRQDSVLVI